MNNFLSSIWFGLILGLLIPIIGSAIVMMIFEQLAKMNIMHTIDGVLSVGRLRSVYLFGIVFNLIPFQYFKRKNQEKVMNGIVIMTIILAAVWIIYFSKTLF